VQPFSAASVRLALFGDSDKITKVHVVHIATIALRQPSNYKVFGEDTEGGAGGGGGGGDFLLAQSTEVPSGDTCGLIGFAAGQSCSAGGNNENGKMSNPVV